MKSTRTEEAGGALTRGCCFLGGYVVGKSAEGQAQEDKVGHPLTACSPEAPGELALEEKEERLCFCEISNKVG